MWTWVPSSTLTVTELRDRFDDAHAEAAAGPRCALDERAAVEDVDGERAVVLRRAKSSTSFSSTPS